jgi:hypothetical protein
MALNRTTLVSKLKDYWAQTDYLECPDDAYGEALDLAARDVMRMGRWRTLRKGQVTTEADVQAYDTVANAVLVEVPGWNSNLTTNSEFGDVIPVNSYYTMDQSLYSRFDSLQYEIQNEQLRQSTDGVHAWQQVGSQLWLMPVPSRTGDTVVYFYFLATDSVERIPNDWEKHLLAGARLHLVRLVWINRNKTASPSTDTGLQMSPMVDKFQNLEHMAIREWKAAKDEIWLSLGGIG